MHRICLRVFLLVTVLLTMGWSVSAQASDGTAVESPATSLELIQADYVSGKISLPEKLVYEVKAVFAPRHLDDKYQTDELTLIKSGTELAMQVRDNWSLFDSSQQAELAAMLNRPSMNNTYTSLSGRFRIHYDTSGTEPVPLQDADSNGIPDYVERIGIYADSAAKVYHDILGYLPPVIDTTGGNIAYDIYLRAIAGYGATIPEWPGDSTWNDYAAYTEIHHNFYGFPSNDDPEGDTIGAMKVTCAHEYFHAVQLAYDYDAANNLWWMEQTAVAMEEYIYPEVNDNFLYLPYFFNYPDRSLRSTENYHMYGGFVWPLYLNNRFGEYVIKASWEATRNNLPEIAIDSALQIYGTTTAKVFNDFVARNYFTGDRAKSAGYFPDAADYPFMAIDQTVSGIEVDSLQPVHAPDGLGADYIKIAVGAEDQGVLAITLEGGSLVRWGMSAIFLRDGFDSTIEAVSGWGNPVHLYYPFIEDYDSVIIAPAVVSKYLTDNNYYLSTKLLPYGDANFDESVNVGDATYIVNFIFKGGNAPQPLYESGDANCDGSVNIGDAVALINFIFKSGPEPCANR